MKLWERIAKVAERYISIAPAKTRTINPENPYDMIGLNPSWRDFLDEAIVRNAKESVLYKDFDEMDNDVPEISAALDITTDFVVYPSNTDKSEIFAVKSKKHQGKIDEINKIVKPHHDLYGMIRDALKYGDNFEETLRLMPTKKDMIGQPIGFKNIDITSVVVNKKNGIVDPASYITQYDPVTQKPVVTLSKDEVFHLSLNSDRRKYSSTGKGVSKLQKARLIYRQVRLMEEGAMIRRLSRANNNYGILVDVGDASGEEALDFLEKYRKKITRRKYVDQSTGKFSYRVNPLSVIEDLYLPTRQGSNAGVVPLNQGSNGDTSMSDVEYFQDKLIYATGTPKMLIGKEYDVNSKSTSDTQMVSFLRSIRRIQMMIEPAIIAFYQSALMSFGITDADDLIVYWPVCGTIDEERKWRIEQLKWQVAAVIGQDLSLVDDYYLYKNFLGLNDDQIKELTKRMDDTEKKISMANDNTSFEDEDEFADEPNKNSGEEDDAEDDTEDEDEPENESPEEREERVYTVLEKNCKTKKERNQLRSFIKAVVTDETMRNLVKDVIDLAKVR